MKYARFFLVSFLLCGLCGSVQGQLCTVTGAGTVPSILPSDTLATIPVFAADSQVIQVAHDGDTVVFGITLVYDSLLIDQITGVPNGMAVTCHAPQASCVAYPDSTGLLRFCLKFVSQLQNPNPASFPNYDSILVDVELFVTSPFGSQSFVQSIPIYWQTSPMPGIFGEHPAAMDLRLRPQPASDDLHVQFTLTGDVDARLTLSDMMGRVCRARNLGMLRSGENQVALDLEGLGTGIYMLSLNLGEAQYTRKVVIVK
jgi:hypothetical protein